MQLHYRPCSKSFIHYNTERCFDPFKRCFLLCDLLVLAESLMYVDPPLTVTVYGDSSSDVVAPCALSDGVIDEHAAVGAPVGLATLTATIEIATRS